MPKLPVTLFRNTHWGKYLGDATMGTIILDRLMHRAVMLEFEGKSYRLKEAAARIALTTDRD
jgi:DNA replication protein DnaC